MNNQDINSQGINAEFKTFLATYPKEALVEIAKRRLGDALNDLGKEEYDEKVSNFIKGMPNNLIHTEADKKLIPVFQKGLDEMKQLVDQMPDAVWELAYKYFPMAIKRCKTEDDRREAISDKFDLSDNEIDATNELKDILKECIADTKFVYKGSENTLFSKDEAQSSTPDTLCQSLEDRLNRMTQMLEEDRDDTRAYIAARSHDSLTEYFNEMAEFLTKKIVENMNPANYVFEYRPEEDALIGRHSSKGLHVITVIPNITDKGDTNNPAEMICDIDVLGIEVPETTSIGDTRDMIELQNYVMDHSKYNPARNGAYTIDFVKASEVPELAYNAIQDWAAAATACNTISDAMEKARVTVGNENMAKLKQAVDINQNINKYGKSTSGISTINPAFFQNQINDLKQRAKEVKPRVGKANDVSQFINELQAKLRDGLGWESIEDNN